MVGFLVRGGGLLGLFVVVVFLGYAGESKPESKPLSPREEQATFKIAKGFVIELVASEPEVVDPVAMAFDERGRLFVAEMHAYPNEGVGTGVVVSGKIKVLEDQDGDGVFEKSTVFADKLRLPNSVMPYRNGLLVSNAPELIFLEDKDGDGKADGQRVLYSGFDLANIQQMLNGLQWGLDNWVYGLAGSKGGSIKSAEKPGQSVVELRGRGIRFKPDQPGSLEPITGGGQFGLAPDDWGNWFVNTNSQHLRHMVLPDHYLRRNPDLPVTAVTLDIADHGAACKVHRLSPFESWRVERTTRRKESADAKRFAATELIPGGFVTSGCGPVIYCADLFPPAYRGNSFICDPANNLVHRDVLAPNGATFTARRGEEDHEFLASTDNWFRPVFLCLGPDGALYLADFYREIIETPLSLPDDIKKRWNLNSRGKGRIWRIRPEGKYQPQKLDLTRASGEELVKHLESRNRWWRITAQRLLVQRQEKGVVPALETLAREADFLPGVVHALWTLRGLEAFHPKLAIRLTQEAEPFARVHALRLAEDYLKAKPGENDPVFDKAPFRDLANDPTPQVRFQAAFSLAEFPTSLYQILRRDLADPWIQTAVLSSVNTPQKAAAQLSLLTVEVAKTTEMHPAHVKLFNKLGYLVATRGKDAELGVAFTVLGRLEKFPRLQGALLEGVGSGLQNQKLTIEDLLRKDSFRLGRFWLDFVEAVARRAGLDNANLEDREEAIRLLGHAPLEVASKVLAPQLLPTQPQAIQLAVVRSLGQHPGVKVAELLLESWPSLSPSIRREVLEVLFARPERVRELLRYIEQNKVLGSQLEPAKLTLLRNYPDAKLRAEALKLLAKQVAPARQKVVETYQAALDLKGEPDRGRAVFKKTCTACHRLEDVGVEVGADLLSVLPNKTPERLLIDILDPSREVDPRFIEYLVATNSGKVVTGLIAAETAASVTLRRAEKTEDTLLRTQIESIQSSAKSLMPEGLEMQLQPQDVADLIAYLMGVVRKK
jgi:putative membrane-bound dehydrogenase-like protein